MSNSAKIIAIIGSYRKNGIVDSTVDELLAAAREEGAITQKVYLIDRHIEFCTNCRACTQQPGDAHGRCVLQDEMESLLAEIEQHDALVLASPMNFFSVTAVMKRFIERLVCFAYWPWGMGAPKTRKRPMNKRAVVIISTAAPSIMILPFSHIAKILKTAATLLGAPQPKVLWIGLAAMKQEQGLSSRIRKKAQRMGRELAQ